MTENQIASELEKVMGVTPYSYQIKVADALVNNKSVILRAPTGAGKTLAVIAPFVAFLFRKKLIYSVPLRVLTHSLYRDVEKLLENHSMTPTVQTGVMKTDPFFEGKLVFATIDQSLSSFFQFPLSLSKRLANINTGAFLDALLVFDESHLMQEAFPTAVWMAEKLLGISQSVFMTATMPVSLCEWIAKKTGAVYIDVPVSDIDRMMHHKNRQIHVNCVNETMSAENVRNNHGNKNLIICNTVDKAISMYHDIKNVFPDDTVEVIHSRFLTDDRTEKENKIKMLFDPADNRKVFLIATQVVEVGIDISADCMHTDLSPADSFIQRIGRLMRRSIDGQQIGTVHVYSEIDKEGDTQFLPYNAELCRKTWMEIKKRPLLQYVETLELIEAVFDDCYISERIAEISAVNDDALSDAFQRHDKGNQSELIRNIDNVYVSVQESINATEIYQYKTISISKKRMIRWIKEQAKLGAIPAWESYEEGDGAREIRPVYSYNGQNVLFLNPDLVTYTKESGLEFRNGPVTYFGKEVNRKKSYESPTMDTYIEHLTACLHAYKSIEDDHAIQLAEELGGMPQNVTEQIILLCLAMHDAGKMNKKWQEGAKKIQESSGNPWPKTFLAHMDNGNGSKVQLPTHAAESAFIVEPMIDNLLSCIEDPRRRHEKKQIFLQAIAHHHTPMLENVQPYTLHEKSESYIEAVLKKYGIHLPVDIRKESHDSSEFPSMSFSPGRFSEWLLYSLIVRVIRLSDQKSFDFIGNIRSEQKKAQPS